VESPHLWYFVLKIRVSLVRYHFLRSWIMKMTAKTMPPKASVRKNAICAPVIRTTRRDYAFQILWVFAKIDEHGKTSKDKHCSYDGDCPHNTHSSLSGAIVWTPTIKRTIAPRPPAITEIHCTASFVKIVPITTRVARYFERSRRTLPASFRRSLFFTPTV
jgi:hypothetical protein